MTVPTIPGFLIAADAIVACKGCGAAVGEACTSLPKDKEKLKPGYVHFGRRVARLLRTAKATAAERETIEREAVELVIKLRAERRRRMS